MVKVLLLKQLFDGQQLVGLNEEPVEIATAPGDVFFVASKTGRRSDHIMRNVGTIVVYLAKGNERTQHVLLHSFHTVNSTIVALEYIPLTDV